MKFNINIESVNYIKIIYQDNNGFAHCIKAAVNNIKENEIVASTKYDGDLYVKTPQEIELSIACDNGLYKAKTILKSVEGDKSYMYYRIVPPVEIDYQQKREFFRVKISEDVVITYEDKKVACETFDISANGIRVVLDEKISFPEEVCLTLYLPSKNVEVGAKYIRTDDEDKILKASFSFVELKESDRDYISQLCLQKQLEMRRKSLL